MALERSTCSTTKSTNDSKKIRSKINSSLNTRDPNNPQNKKDASARFNISSMSQAVQIENKYSTHPLKKKPPNKEVSSSSEISQKPNPNEKHKGNYVNERNEKIIESEEIYCCSCKKKILSKEADENSVDYHRKIFSLRKNVTLDDFHTISVIGQGGYSIVRLVFDIHTGHVYALKQAKKSQKMNSKPPNDNLENLIEIDINSSKKRAEGHTLNTGLMLNTEISLMYNSDSPWINKLYYYWEDNHFYFMLMEYMPGGDLMRHLIDLHTFDEETAKFYIAELLLALDYLNSVQGHIHRDIKPDNILLDLDGHIKLIDFGLSKQIIQSKQRPLVSNAAINTVIQKENGIGLDPREILIHDQNFHAGTPDYMAPEIHRGDPYSLCVDLWSVGIILFEMLFGGPPLSDPGQNSLITRNKVMNWDKHFYLPSEHHKYSKDAIDFICSLVCEPSQRIKSAKEAMKHPFFKGMDFSKIRLQKPPIVPVVKHKLDHSNFDKFPDDLITSFYNSANAPTLTPNISEEFNASSCKTNRKSGENYISEFFPSSAIPGMHKLSNSHKIAENSSISTMNGSKICTPKRSYVPLVTHMSSPVSNSTATSSWKHINSSPIFHTPRKLSPLTNNPNQRVPLNSYIHPQSHSYSQIIGKPTHNLSNSNNSHPRAPQSFNVLTSRDKISNIPNSIFESLKSKHQTPSSTILNPNIGTPRSHTFLTFKERKSSENNIYRQFQNNNCHLFPQRSASPSITKNNQDIVNILRKKNLI
ncbi:S/T protein kinase [Cryptosporidium canis]|uniref:non-specific serine/threonine protein kinase n=1 Tax=Cryptosporidium canis TaxID=195482 RepID=A0A9D5HXU1_9CRYT|nr:S/T protein kinase [Cryptosporidium canis]